MKGQRGITTLGDRVDSSLLKGYWSNPMDCWVMRAAKLSGVPLQCAQGCLSAAPGSAAAELKLCQDSQKPTFLTDGTTLLIPCKGDAAGQDGTTHLSCSPVISTSASRSSSAAFFCMVFPIPSMSVLTHDAHNKDIILQRGGRANVTISFYMLKKNSLYNNNGKPHATF